VGLRDAPGMSDRPRVGPGCPLTHNARHDVRRRPLSPFMRTEWIEIV